LLLLQTELQKTEGLSTENVRHEISNLTSHIDKLAAQLEASASSENMGQNIESVKFAIVHEIQDSLEKQNYALCKKIESSVSQEIQACVSKSISAHYRQLEDLHSKLETIAKGKEFSQEKLLAKIDGKFKENINIEIFQWDMELS
jgi:DNA repair exonuclease SbcCD ATPase subunit